MTLVERTLAQVRVPRPGGGRLKEASRSRLIADLGYDSDPLRRQLGARGIEVICPHRKNRCKPPTQDGCKLRRFRRRWKVERPFAWLGNFRRLVVRYDRSLFMYNAFSHVACLIITLRHL